MIILGLEVCCLELIFRPIQVEASPSFGEGDTTISLDPDSGLPCSPGADFFPPIPPACALLLASAQFSADFFLEEGETSKSRQTTTEIWSAV